MEINKIKIAATYIAQNTTLFGFPEGRRLLLKRMKSEVEDRVLESWDAGSLGPFAGLLGSTTPFPRWLPRQEGHRRCQRASQEAHTSWVWPRSSLPRARPCGQVSPAAGQDLQDRAWLQSDTGRQPVERAGRRRTCPRATEAQGTGSGEDGTGLRHVHDRGRPELLSSCRKPATLSFAGRKWGPEKWRSWATSPPHATDTLFGSPTATTTTRKTSLFPFQPRK